MPRIRLFTFVVLFGIAALGMAPSPAKASLIQNFTFSRSFNGTPVFTGGGTATFDGLGNMTDLDIQGTIGDITGVNTAKFTTFNIPNITGTGNVNSLWQLADWAWASPKVTLAQPGSSSFAYDLTLTGSTNSAGTHIINAIIFTNIRPVSDICANLVGAACGYTSVVTASGVHAVPEPSSLAIFAFSLVGLGWMRRRKRGVAA